MQEAGIVKSIEGDIAVIKMQRGAKCDGCTACRMAEGGVMEIDAFNDKDAKIGDHVNIEIKPSKIMGHSFLIFIFPLIALIIGYILGNHLLPTKPESEGPGIIGGLIGLGLSFIIIKTYDTYWNKKHRYLAEIINIEDQA